MEPVIHYTKRSENNSDYLIYTASQYWSPGQKQYISMYKSSTSNNYQSITASKNVGRKFGSKNLFYFINKTLSKQIFFNRIKRVYKIFGN
jgi:hypothetical protein